MLRTIWDPSLTESYSMMTATMGLCVVTERCLKNHHRLYYLKRNGSNWFTSTLKKPLWLMNVFLRKTEKSAETPVTWSMSKQPVTCKLFCVCESSCLGHSKTVVGTQGGGREFQWWFFKHRSVTNDRPIVAKEQMPQRFLCKNVRRMDRK